MLECFTEISDPSIPWFYNDQQPGTIFYQGLALQKLGQDKEAQNRFDKLIAFGKAHLEDSVTIDYFAVSLPDLTVWEENLDDRNKIHCFYLMALGYDGKGEKEQAKMYYDKTLEQCNTHFGACVHQ